MGKLNFRYAAMNAGKTDELLRIADSYELKDMPVIVAKPSIDTKGGQEIVSRRGGSREVDTVIAPESDIVEVFEPLLVTKGALRAVECILIDEAQFLQPEQVDSLYWDITHDRDTSVIAFGLRADAFAKFFPGSAELMALADDIREIITMCGCGTQAQMNTRMINGRYVFEGEQVAIDGEGVVTYDSLCKDCYRREYLSYFAAKESLEQNVASAL